MKYVPKWCTFPIVTNFPNKLFLSVDSFDMSQNDERDVGLINILDKGELPHSGENDENRN